MGWSTRYHAVVLRVVVRGVRGRGRGRFVVGIYPAVHRRLMTDDRSIDDDMLRDVVTGASGHWPRATAWLGAHAEAVAARLRANGQQAYSIGLAGTPAIWQGGCL